MSEMAGFKNISKLNFIFIFLFSVSSAFSATKVYVFSGKIETIRKDSIITILTDENINDKDFYIVENFKKVAEFTILSNEKTISGNRIIASLKIIDPGFTARAGLDIGFISANITSKLEYPDYLRKDETKYKEKIVSRIDGREMVLVQKGKTFIGNNDAVNDEYPKHEVYLDDYYIDKYEVSNLEYLQFIKKTGKPLPVSWKSTEFAEMNPNLPVIVTFTEAEEFARWAGKKIPTEKEWEKAASGNKKYTQIRVSDGFYELLITTKFPWGNNISTEFSNCREYWLKSGKPPGLMKVNAFENTNVSAFGAVNMSGNAAEWTDSWYDAYSENVTTNPLFGKKVKVIRGGNWYDSITDQTIQKRKYGGIPNLKEDSIAGFRCIKIPDYDDIEKK